MEGSNHHHQVAIIMVPFLEHSHLNQLLHLSCLIASSYSIPIHYVSSSIHINQAKTRARNLNPSHMAMIRFHGLPMPDFESPPPDHGSSVKFPTHLLPLWKAAASLRQPFAHYLREMARTFERVVVIHDFMTSSIVQDVGSVENAESYVFNPISAFSMASFLLKGSDGGISKDLPSIEDCVPGEVWELSASQREPSKQRSGDLYNTVRSLEATFLDMLSRNGFSEGGKIWAIGPMLPTKPSPSGREGGHDCLKWLDGHEPDSVIYVSFGTTTSLSDEQTRELALGLEQSGGKFLWIMRDADRGNSLDGEMRRIELPQGFEERTKGVGLVVRDWAPQVDILAHPSTGGFVSHCGWNSILESLTMGVPLATWPMHSEQPRNAYFVTEILKAGVSVREWTMRGDVAKASVIAEAVRRLRMASEGGDSVRKRAREIGAALKRATEEGGESKVEMDMFIAHVRRK